MLEGVTGIQLLAIDCPGHGKSPLTSHNPVSFNYYSDEVIRYLDSLGIEQAIFGGISMGSGIGLNIAIRYPERVLGLILVRPAWLDVSSPENLSILVDAIPFMQMRNGKKEFIETLDFKHLNNLCPLGAQSVLGIFGEHQQTSLTSVISHMVADHPFDELEALQNITTPSLVIANDNDPLHPYEIAEKIAQNIADCELIKVISPYINRNLHQNTVREIIQDYLIKKIRKDL